MMARKSYLLLVAAVCLVCATSLWAQKTKRIARSKDITIRGKLMDIHSYMTGRTDNEDAVRATQDSFRTGAAAGIDTEQGFVILGSGEKGPARMIVPLARQQVEARGRLFEKQGLKYLDLISIQAARTGEESETKPVEEEHEVTHEEHEGTAEEAPPVEEHAPEETEAEEEPAEEEP